MYTASLFLSIPRCRCVEPDAGPVFAGSRARPSTSLFDGKTLRGSRRLDDKAIHVLSAFATELGAVIGELTVEPDQNEITAALVLLKGLPLEGRIITGDAIFTQREDLPSYPATATAITSSQSRTISPL